MKIIIVDDNRLFRTSLVNLLTSQPDFEVVGEAGTVQEALSLVEIKHPDLLVTDLNLPDGSGTGSISAILQKRPNLAIVFLATSIDEHLAFAALRLGVKGFLRKDIAAAALLNALRGLTRGELAVPRLMLSSFIDEMMPMFRSQNGQKNNLNPTLTLREIDVILELSTGASNREIARRLSISENTVKVHVHEILRKLKLKSRKEIAAYAHTHGLAVESLELPPLTTYRRERATAPENLK